MGLLKALSTIGGQIAKNYAKKKVVDYGVQTAQDWKEERTYLPDHVDKQVPTVIDSAWKRRDYAEQYLGFTEQQVPKFRGLSFTQGDPSDFAYDEPKIDKEDFLRRTDEALTASFRKMGLVSGQKEAARELLEIPGRGLRSFVDAATFGLSKVARQKADPTEDMEFEPVTEYGRHVKKSFGTVSKTMEIGGAVAGTFAGYAPVAKAVSKAFTSVPRFAKFAAPMASNASKAERAKRFLFYGGLTNLGEEAVDASIRKLSGQEYDAWDFALGMAAGGVFEGVGVLKGADIRGALKKTPKRAKRRLGELFEKFAKKNDRPPIGEEILDLMGQVKASRRQTVRQVFEQTPMFREARMLNLKPKNFDDFTKIQAGRALKTEVTDDLKLLYEEARKHKSADAFIKAQADELINEIINDTGLGTVRLYHGTDSDTAKQIYKSQQFNSSADYPSFFTTRKSEALEYARNKTKHRGVGSPEIIEIEVPKYAVHKHPSTGEYETIPGVPLKIAGKTGYIDDVALLKAYEKFPKGIDPSDIWNRANLKSYGGQSFPDPSSLSMRDPRRFAQLSDYTPKERKVRGFIESAADDKRIAPEIKDQFNKVENAKKVTYEAITNKDTVRTARKMMARKSDFEVRQQIVNGGLTPENAAMGQLQLRKLQQQGKYDEAADLVMELSKRATTAGQYVQSLSMLQRLDENGVLIMGQKVLNNAKRAAKKAKWADQLPDGLSEDQIKQLTGRAKKIKQMPPGRQKDLETGLLYRDLAEIVPASIARQLSTAQVMAQLLNFKTIGRNIIGNTGFQMADRIARGIGTFLDIGVSKITGKRTIAGGSIKELVKGGKKGATEGWEEAIRGIDLSGTESKFELDEIGKSYGGQTGRTFRGDTKLGKVGQRLEQALNVSLRVPDRAAYEGAFRDELYSLGMVDAINKKVPSKQREAHIQNFMKTAPEEIVNVARQKALYVTFQDENTFTEFFQGLKKLFNKVSIKRGKEQFGLGDLVLKYAKTPANILRAGIQYSPLGTGKAAVQAFQKQQREALLNFSRSILGTTIGALGFKLSSLGILNYPDDDTTKVRQFERDMGVDGPKINFNALQRYIFSGFDDAAASYKEGDTLTSYNWLEPLAFGMTAGASLQNELDEKLKTGQLKYTDSFRLLGSVLSSSLDASNEIIDQPMLQGLRRLARSQDPVEELVYTIASAPQSMVPTVLKQVRQYVDNTARETYDPNRIVQEAKRALNKIPGLHKLLPERKNLYGQNEDMFKNKTYGLFNVFLNPSFVSKKKDDPIGDEILRLYRETGETDHLPVVVPKKIRVGDSVNESLSTEEYNKMKTTTGKISRQILEQVVGSAGYDGLTDEEKRKEIRGGVREAYNIGKGEYYFNSAKKIRDKQGDEAALYYLNERLTESQQKLYMKYSELKAAQS